MWIDGRPRDWPGEDARAGPLGLATGGVAMKAALYHRYGRPEEVVRVEEVERPLPGDGEVLIAIRAASVNPADLHFMRGRPYVARLAFGLRGPKLTRPGVEAAGIVEAVGPEVTRFGPGDRVFGACRGALAEYGCSPEAKLAAIPPGISFDQAAGVPVAGLTALQGLRNKGRLEPGQKVLIVGAAGGIGTFAVQIAKALGAQVTAVCSADAADMVRAIGADRVIDYGEEDFTRGEESYDLILDLAASRSFAACRRVLAPSGMLIPCGMAAGGGAPSAPWLTGWAARFAGGLLMSRFSRRTMGTFVTRLDAADLDFLASLMADGKIRTVVDRRYGLDEAAEALGHLLAGHARGKTIVTIGQEGA
jgi:NADPH:quinone reductase-like Zn-dependent oxidoreductase